MAGGGGGQTARHEVLLVTEKPFIYGIFHDVSPGRTRQEQMTTVTNLKRA